MMTIVIGVLGLIVLICTASNGEWGAFGITLAVLLGLIFMAACEREHVKARNNRDRYWANMDK